MGNNFDPSHRRLVQITLDDARDAVDEIFETLMGDEVKPRREFIDDNALRAEKCRYLKILQKICIQIFDFNSFLFHRISVSYCNI